MLRQPSEWSKRAGGLFVFDMSTKPNFRVCFQYVCSAGPPRLWVTRHAHWTAPRCMVAQKALEVCQESATSFAFQEALLYFLQRGNCFTMQEYFRKLYGRLYAFSNVNIKQLLSFSKRTVAYSCIQTTVTAQSG